MDVAVEKAKKVRPQVAMHPPTLTHRIACCLASLALLVLLAPAHAIVEVVKSPNDSRDYAYFELANGLRALVVSDPDADMAAAAVDVNIGSASDPSERPGLAHFLEHMLFLGTEKYPQAGSYQRFIGAHGGRHNAYTSSEHTNYFFDIDHNYLEPALSRLAQFFTAPLFTSDYVQRERLAVHSEYQLKLKDDSWRAMQAVKQTLNPANPLSRFSIGALSSLSDNDQTKVRDELIAFYRKHYSAGLMTVVVLGREPTAQLRAWVSEKFAKVPNTGAQPLRVEAPLFAPGSLPARLDVVPLKEQRRLSLAFPIPSPREHYSAKPVYFISSLLGHEGEGSLFSLLRRKDWAESLSAGAGRSVDEQTTFTVDVRLTRGGLDHVDTIIGHVFAYVRLIEAALDGSGATAKSLFDEQRQLAQIQFTYLEEASAVRYASALAKSLQDYPAQDVLRTGYLFEDFDEALVRDYLAKLRPDNVLVTVRAPGLETDAVAPWFDTPYRLSAVDDETLASWSNGPVNEALALPGHNVFLPGDLALRPIKDPADKPRLIRSTPGLAVWFMQDQEFRVPRADFYFAIRSPEVMATPRNLVLSKIYLKLIQDQLTEQTYPASLAGLGYQLGTGGRGIFGSVSGLSDQQDRLLELLLATLRQPLLEENRFALFKQQLQRRLENSHKESPYRQAMAELPNLLITPHWSDTEQLAALSDVTLADLGELVGKIYRRLEVVVLAHGNLRAADALRMAKLLEQELLAQSEAITVPRAKVVKLAPGELPVRELEVDHSDSALVTYFQGGEASFRDRARFGLLGQILSAPFYQSLRTEQQLGYVVFASAMPLMEVPGLLFVVQSPVASPDLVEARVEHFLADFETHLATMPADELQRHRQALVTKLLERPTDLRERTDMLWSDLAYDHLDFDSRQQIAAAVLAIDAETVRSDFTRFLIGGDRRALIVAAPGNDAGQWLARRQSEAADAVIGDTLLFKKGRKLYTD